MSNQPGSPKELMPSFVQWEALVKVCASVLCPTTFGIRVDQLLKLAGYDHPTDVSSWAGHPQDMAKIIFAIGRVAAGELLELHIVGGPACSWVAVYADLVLGLRGPRLVISFGPASRTKLTEVNIRVAVATDHEPALYLNFDTSSARPQVEVQFTHDIACNAITCVGRVFTLRSGDDFIRSILHQTSEDHEPFLGGRLSRDSMFMETFGTAAENLLKPSSCMNGPCSNSERPKTESGRFVRLFVACAQYYVFCARDSAGYKSEKEFILTATNQVPELRPLKEEFEELLLADTATDPRRSDIESKLGPARHDLKCVCRCAVHNRHTLDNQDTARFWSVALALTIIDISYILSHISVEASLTPRRSGILAIYSQMPRHLDDEERYGGVQETLMKRVWKIGLNVSRIVELLGVSLFE
ncbi:MAG: hypothetical protein L6R36_000821 [Xanthoria steineri]|nr:MAG: hypothetical protein L6R36_000821 [Xanthoria steineri]